jgi:hypothetical protein
VLGAGCAGARVLGARVRGWCGRAYVPAEARVAPDVRAVEALVVLDRALVQQQCCRRVPNAGALWPPRALALAKAQRQAPMGAVYREEGQPNDNVRRFRMVSEVGANAFAAFQARTVAAV